MKMNQKAKFRIGVLIYLLLCLALYVCIYIVPKVSDIFVETYVAEYGSLQIGEESEALFVRNERLYTADGGGATDRVISGGSLMRKGSRIVTVGGQGYYSGENGIVSYFYDGLESVLTPETMATADSSFLQKVKQKPQEGEPNYSLRKCVSGTAAAGDPIFKIVDNSQWYIICWLEKDKAEDYQENNTVLVGFGDEDESPIRDENQQHCSAGGQAASDSVLQPLLYKFSEAAHQSLQTHPFRQERNPFGNRQHYGGQRAKGRFCS